MPDEDLGRQLSAEHRTSSWDHKPQAIVYDPSLDTFETEDCGGECNNLTTEQLLICSQLLQLPGSPSLVE